MKSLIIALLVIASVSSVTYVSVCDYISADACRNYVIEHQSSLQWCPAEFPYRHFGYPESKQGGCFVLPLSDYGMGYYTDMTIQRIGCNYCEIIAWSNRSKFLYRWKKVDRVFVIENDSLLISIIQNRMPKDTVIATSYSIETSAHELFDAYKAKDEFLRRNIQQELRDTIRAIMASHGIASVRDGRVASALREATQLIMSRQLYVEKMQMEAAFPDNK